MSLSEACSSGASLTKIHSQTDSYVYAPQPYYQHGRGRAAPQQYVGPQQVYIDPRIGTATGTIHRSRKKSDHALIEQLRKRPRVKRIVINEKPTIVHEPPVVIEKRHVIDVPVVIEKRRYVDDAPAPQSRRKRAKTENSKTENSKEANVRVIRAEAEVRIMGKDQMSIRLYRKGGAPVESND